MMETAEDLFAERDAEEKVWAHGQAGDQAPQARLQRVYYGFKTFGKLLEGRHATAS